MGTSTSKGPVRQHRLVRRHHHVPRNCRQNAEGDHCSCSINNEDQDHCSTREKVFCLDRRIHPCFFSPPSNRCGSPSRNMMSLAPQLSTENASKKFKLFLFTHLRQFVSPMHFSTNVEVLYLILIL